jgi:hypothetical protein
MMRTGWLSVVLLLAAGALALHAQAPDIARDQPGRWAIRNGDELVKVIASANPINVPLRSGPEITPDERSHVQTWINQLIDVLRRTPVLGQPRGFDVNIHMPLIDLRDLDGQGATNGPAYVTTAVTIELTPYENGSNGPPANGAHAAATIELVINRPAEVLAGTHSAGRGVTADDEGVEFLQEPVPPDETRHGLPTYLGPRVDEWKVLMTRSKAPLFAPVTREQVLRSVIDVVQKQSKRPLASTSMGPPPSNDPATLAAWQEAERRMAEIRQTYQESISHLQQQLDGLTKQLAAMSAAERSAPTFAWNVGPSGAGPIEFLQEGDGNALPVVRRNPALMDDRLPRWTPQLLIITFEGDDRWPGLAAKVEQELDWAGLQKFLG